MSQNTDSLKETLQVLISSCGDKEESVNNSVIKSLIRLATVNPNEVVAYICDYYKSDPKVGTQQLGNLIKVLEQTCVNHMKEIQGNLPAELVTSMLSAMTQSMDYEPMVQLGASAVLVAVGHVHLDLVLQSLMKQMTPSSVPHYTLPHTLGTLAAVNTHTIVPFVKDILAKMLPLLPLVKVEGTKQAFAYAFGHFAVAVSEQIGDNVENDNITSIKENFVVEFSVIFDVLYNQWLHSHEAKVIESVLEALGPITRLIPDRKFDEIVNKFVLSLLALYRKTNINYYFISQCISYLLTPSPLNPKVTLNDNVISSMNHTLFNLVVLEPDYDQPHTVKNHFEVLRCFDHMAGQFPDQTVDSLLNHCKNNNLKERMKAVIILTHLTTSSQVFVEKYAQKFIAILKVMITMEQSFTMKKLLAKSIVSLVYRNCLVNTEDFNMVEFIVKHCEFEPPNGNNAEANDLIYTCRSSLILMCNSATNVRCQLRDLLLKAMTVEDFTPSLSTITNCLTSLLQNNSEIAVEEKVDRPADAKVSPDLIFVRCITHLAEPHKVERNKNILLFLDEYSGDIHKNLKNSWAVEVERLLKFVQNEPNEDWHDMLLDLLVAAIEQVNSNKWVENISTLLSQQIVSTKQSPMIKGMSLQFLATLTCHMSNAAVVEQVLKIILFALKSIPMESVEYVSKAVGIASRQHGEYIMNDLDAVYKDVESRRGSKLLNFISTRSSKMEEWNIMKYAIIVCYGRVAVECLDVHVLARLGDNVTGILYEILNSNPNMDLCRATVTTLYHISKALQPALHHNVTLRNRWQLLNSVLEQIFNPNLEKRNVELFPIIVKASKGLTKLQKGILPEERNTILKVLFTSIFGELSSYKKKYETEGNGDQNDHLAKTLNDSLTHLHALIRELIIQSTCLSTIDDLVSLLIEWLRHKNDEIRTASILIFQVIFDTYIKNVKLNYETPSKFGQMGFLLGLIVPGVSDTNFPVRLTTVDCIKLIISLQYLYEGHTIEPDDKCMLDLAALHEDVLTNDKKKISDYCTSLMDTMSDKIPHHHTMQFIESLLEGYGDEELRSLGSSSILNALFVKKGQDLYQNIERIVEVILVTMDTVGEDAKMKLMKPLTSLARHHSNAVTAVLLAQRIPLKPCVITCWRSLAQDASIATAIVDNFLRLMTSVELFEDPYHITENHIAALQPLTLISALSEMLQEKSMKEICRHKFAEIFVTLYMTLACYIEASPPAYIIPTNRTQERFGFIPNREAIKLSPAKITMAALIAFFEQTELYELKEVCLNLSSDQLECTSTLTILATRLASASTSAAAAAAKYASSQLQPHRAAHLTLLRAMLLQRCNDNPVLTESVLSSLKAGWHDESPRVRATAMQAAAAVARLRAPHNAKALPKALSALSQGVDAQNTIILTDNVPLAAIEGLIELLTELDSMEKEYERELLSIAQKIRPYMNTDSAVLRRHAIRLFGIISGKVKNEAFVEQAISSLPCFLLHLCDNNQDVVKASKFTLKQIFKTFNTPKSNDLIQTHLVDEGRLFLDDFLAALLRNLAKEQPDSIGKCLQSAVNFLHCAREDLKPYPPLLVGKLCMELYALRETHPEDSMVDPDVTKSARTRLFSLIKDQNPLVRQHCSMALAYLCLVSNK